MSYKKHREKKLVFVYGTLLSDLPNHYLLFDSVCLGNAKTVDKMKLTVSGIPFLSKKEEVSRIVGEVYEVTEDVLKTLDKLEGYQGKNVTNFYEREEIEVLIGRSKTPITCFSYLNNDFLKHECISDIGYKKYYNNKYKIKNESSNNKK